MPTRHVKLKKNVVKRLLCLTFQRSLDVVDEDLGPFTSPEGIVGLVHVLVGVFEPADVVGLVAAGTFEFSRQNEAGEREAQSPGGAHLAISAESEKMHLGLQSLFFAGHEKNKTFFFGSGYFLILRER